MRIYSKSFKNGDPFPVEFAFGRFHPTDHVALSENKNPHLAWEDLPGNTKSLVILCKDIDVPSKGDDVNVEGRTVPYVLERTDFFHWVLINVDPVLGEISAGEFSDRVVPRGKSGPASPRNTLSGLNDYTDWFANDEAMHGNYFGYDGPCPPWNDERIHRYEFSVHALDVEKLDIESPFRGHDVRKAMQDHELASAKIVATYHIYPDAR